MKAGAKPRRLGMGIRFVDVVTQWVYRLSAGRLGERELSYSMLLLQTVGRRSGKARTHTFPATAAFRSAGLCIVNVVWVNNHV